jgi:anti-sigma regulatory factor (Ser/Thr protein kinase)
MVMREEFRAALSKIVVRCRPHTLLHRDVTEFAMPASGPPAWTLLLDDAGGGGDARLHFVQFLQSVRNDEEFLDKAELIFGELLGNVVRHAPGPVKISVELQDDSIVLHVVDSGPPLHSARRRLPDDILSERGRGLFIVAQLATDVRVERVRGRGNHISVTVKL